MSNLKTEENKKETCHTCKTRYTRHMMIQSCFDTYKCIRCYNGGKVLINYRKKAKKILFNTN